MGVDRDSWDYQRRHQPPLEQWELRCLRQIIGKRGILFGMLDEYEQDEARRRVFGDLFHDARTFGIGILTLVNIGAAVYTAFVR